MNPEVDEKNLEVTLPVASPEPCEREDENGVAYQEVLRVTPEAVDLTRLNGGAAVLRNHDTDHTYGVVKRAFIEGGRLYTRLRFRKNEPEAVAAFRDAVDGTLPNVSLGYQPLEIEFRQENGVRIGEVTRWMPFEVSVAVGVPADATVGFYRSMTKTGESKMEVESKEPTSDELRAKIRELEEENAQLKKRSEDPPPEDGEKEDPPPEEKKEETRSACNESELRAMAATFNRLDLLPGALQRNMSPAAFKSEIQNNLYRGSIKVMEKTSIRLCGRSARWWTKAWTPLSSARNRRGSTVRPG